MGSKQQGNPQPAGIVVPSNQQQPSQGYPEKQGYPQQQPATQQGGPSVSLDMGPQTHVETSDDNGRFGDLGWAKPTGMFAEKAIRQAFVSKVYSILTIQLIFTSIIIGLFVLNPDVKAYFKHSQGWMFLGFGLVLIAFLILACNESARRTTPTNFILLGILTLGYSLVAAVASCRFDTKIVMLAFVATGISCFLIATFARSTKFDMTNCGTTLCLLCLGHMVVGTIMVMILVPMGYANVASLAFSTGGALITSLYLIFDLQLIMGGRKSELSPEEYILGAIILYMDIVQMFLYMLEIMNSASAD